MCDLSKKDILAKLKYSAKLAGLPRFMTRKQLIEIGHMLNATAWIVPKAAISNDNNLIIDNKH
ncbi:6384_t:CDS:2, partial [Funneliformis geosporum]